MLLVNHASAWVAPAISVVFVVWGAGWVECKFVIFALFSANRPLFSAGGKARFTKSTVFATREGFAENLTLASADAWPMCSVLCFSVTCKRGIAQERFMNVTLLLRVLMLLGS